MKKWQKCILIILYKLLEKNLSREDIQNIAHRKVVNKGGIQKFQRSFIYLTTQITNFQSLFLIL